MNLFGVQTATIINDQLKLPEPNVTNTLSSIPTLWIPVNGLILIKHSKHLLLLQLAHSPECFYVTSAHSQLRVQDLAWGDVDMCYTVGPFWSVNGAFMFDKRLIGKQVCVIWLILILCYLTYLLNWYKLIAFYVSWGQINTWQDAHTCMIMSKYIYLIVLVWKMSTN